MSEISEVRIEDSAGAFDIVLVNAENGKESSYHIDQEDSHKLLVAVFKKLGIKSVKYREVY